MRKIFDPSWLFLALALLTGQAFAAGSVNPGRDIQGFVYNSDGTGPASGVSIASPAHLSTQLPQAGQMIGRNVVVNGGIEVSQVLGSASSVPATGSYPVDNVQIVETTASTFSTVQVNSTNVGTYTAGYLGSLGATNALQIGVNATHGAPAATDEFSLYFPIEGLNFSRFQYGTANAKAGSLQFKTHCSVSGTYSGAIQNYAHTRSYPFSFSCTAGVDAQVYIQNIPGDTGGTWVGNTNAGAAYVTFDLGSGANFKSTAGTWQTGDFNGVTGTTNLSAQANGSTLTITDVQFEVGSFSTQFERKLYSQVLADCQRYLPVFQLVLGSLVGNGFATTSSSPIATIMLPVQTRVPVTGFVATNGWAAWAYTNTQTAVTNIVSINSAGINMISVVLTTAAVLTAGQSGYFYASTTGYIVFTGAQI